MSDDTNKRIGDYEILSVLGTGGMGRVYKVRNVISDRVEAMKILLPDLAGRQELAERFLREIKLLAALDHPNIAALRTALTVNNQLVMVMEYVEGSTLAQRLEQGPLPANEALNYIDQVLSALGYAHQRQVIHRDIKPSNMMLTPQGVVKLMDFGIARSGTDRGLTMTGTTLGSLYYMSPEQVKGANTDARSDLYSVGVSLYEMVTGQRPFQADSDYSILAAHLQQPPKPPVELRSDLPPGLSDLILMAMEKDPARRFQSADSFRTALKSIRSGAAAQKVPAQNVAAAPVAPAVAAAAPPTSASSATALFNQSAPAPGANYTAPPAQTPLPPVGQYGSDISAPAAAGHRGLYMALGAFVVLIVLVAAGLYVPRRMKAKAAQEVAPASQTTTDNSQSSSPSASSSAAADSANPPAPDSNAGSTSSNTPPNTPPPDSTGAATPATPTDSAHGPSAASPAKTPKDQPTASGKSHASRAATDKVVLPSTPPDAGPSGEISATRADSGTAPDQAAAQMEELERQFDQVSTRANAVGGSLDTLQRQQAAQGLNLRGDIAASQERLRTYVGKAQAALQNQDAKGAQKYLNLAEPELMRIEKFLGH